MADRHIDRLIESLEATFDAGLARAEEEAASDLALSLLQDAELIDVLRRRGPLNALLPDGITLPVSSIGENYLACGSSGDVLVPLATAMVAAAPSGPSPQMSGLSLLGLLRQLVRRGRHVEIWGSGVRLRGRLARACADHVVVEVPRGPDGDGAEVFVGVRALERIRLLPGSEGGRC